MDFDRLPIYDAADIVVCGGGTAGAFAAIAAAGEGKNVLLIEQLGMLGGSATAGLVTPLMHSGVPGNPFCSAIGEEVQKRMLALGASSENGRAFDPMMLRIVLEKMCREAGVRLLYHTFIPETIVKNGRVEAVVIANKAGLSQVKGKIFIDCTGDGDVCVRAGANYRQGNPETGKNQPMSLRYIVENVDLKRFRAYVEEKKKETGISAGVDIGEDGVYAYVECDPQADSVLNGCFLEAVEKGELLQEDFLYWQGFYIPGRKGCLAFNCPEFFDQVDGTDPRHLTCNQIEGKERILRHLAFYRKHFPGFENACIGDIAVLMGVRETREIETEKMLDAGELWGKKKCPDMICQSNYPIDVHGRVLSNQFLGDQADDGKPWYDIPYGCLVVRGFENLLVAGRCAGADFYAQASIRIQETARSTGEAAGIAAALALEKGITPREMDGALIRKRMMENGAVYAKE